MRNITLSADDDLIERARALARARKKTLNTAFREWLEQFVSETGSATGYRSLMTRLGHVNSGSRFSRDEMNER